MPHSELISARTKMTPQVNGARPSSAFLSHLTSFPIVNDSITTFKANLYGAKSLDVTQLGYQKLGKPFLPYLAGPYEYVSPYVQRADSLGDSTLSTLESRFPAVRKPTGELYDTGKALVFFPLTKGAEGKEYLMSTYSDEIKKVGGEGIVTYSKAALSTSLIVSSEALSWLTGFLSKKKVEAEEVASEKVNNH